MSLPATRSCAAPRNSSTDGLAVTLNTRWDICFESPSFHRSNATSLNAEPQPFPRHSVRARAQTMTQPHAKACCPRSSRLCSAVLADTFLSARSAKVAIVTNNPEWRHTINIDQQPVIGVFHFHQLLPHFITAFTPDMQHCSTSTGHGLANPGLLASHPQDVCRRSCNADGAQIDDPLISISCKSPSVQSWLTNSRCIERSSERTQRPSTDRMPACPEGD